MKKEFLGYQDFIVNLNTPSGLELDTDERFYTHGWEGDFGSGKMDKPTMTIKKDTKKGRGS